MDIKKLESELVHLKQEKNELTKRLIKQNRDFGLFEAIVDELKRSILPLKAKAKTTTKTKNSNEDIVLVLSDMHADLCVTYKQTGGIEEYNFNIACARAEHLIDTIIHWTQHILSTRSQRLFILSLGDHTSGEIHNNVSRSYFCNQFKNCLSIGQLQALMINDLAPYFKSVNVICVPGNHGRRTKKKDHLGAHDNWDYLISRIAELYCLSLRNVTFTIPDAFNINVEIAGIGCHLSHGDDIKNTCGLPFYGLVHKYKCLQNQKMAIRYTYCGHFHRGATLTDVNGEIIVNGAWFAADSYSFNKYSDYREPMQLLHGMSADAGITWRLPVKLKREKEKATRYDINNDN